MRENFKPAGEVLFAQFAAKEPLFTQTKIQLTETQKQGLRYEKRVQEHLRELCLKTVPALDGWKCLCNQWLLYRSRHMDATALAVCQPDCLLINHDRKKVIIAECKLSHTGDSWKQLRQLYEPVVRKIFPSSEISLIEICKWFDPHSPFPESFYYEENILMAQAGRIAIHIYKPRGRSKKLK